LISETLFKYVVESNIIGIMVADLAGRITESNDYFLHLIGYSRPELEAGLLDWQKLTPPEFAELDSRKKDELLAQRTCALYEKQYFHKKGARIDVLLGASLLGDEKDRCICYILDIRDKKRTERALQESEVRFRSLAEASPVPIVLIDTEGVITYYNQACEEFFGEAHDKIDPEGFYSIIHPDDRPRVIAARQAMQASPFPDQAYRYETRARNRHGEYRWVLISRGARFVGNEFHGFVSLAIDITDRKKAEEALKESEQLFKTIADTVPAMIYMHDENDSVEFANKALLDFSGYKLEDVIGLPIDSDAWRRLIHPDDAQRLFPGYREAVLQRKPYTHEIRVRHQDGGYLWTTLSGAPRYDHMGRFAGYTGVYSDISKLKEAERQNNELRESLEKKVVERTAELEAVNKELESFSYSISHDLRAPLRGIDGMSLAILEDYRNRLDDRGRRYLEILRKEAQHMGELINEMLNLSRLTRGALHWDSVNLSETALEIAGNLQWQEPQRQVTFKIRPDVVVRGDAHLLRAVLENLLGNAWKFTSKHPAATIEFGLEEQDGQPVYFVKDDGAGFDMEYAEKLFHAFQRLHTVSEFPGSGIGLATVQRIIHRHGGRVWAKGEVEKGAQVFFTLGSTHTLKANPGS
jgi:PAS domain S-box-containing protein